MTPFLPFSPWPCAQRLFLFFLIALSWRLDRSGVVGVLANQRERLAKQQKTYKSISEIICVGAHRTLTTRIVCLNRREQKGRIQKNKQHEKTDVKEGRRGKRERAREQTKRTSRENKDGVILSPYPPLQQTSFPSISRYRSSISADMRAASLYKAPRSRFVCTRFKCSWDNLTLHFFLVSILSRSGSF